MENIIIENMPDLPYAMEEAMNRLRVNVSFLGNDVKKILIVSSLPNEGKSFVALHLWKQMAEAGFPSVFFDMDLRKSVLIDRYGIKATGNGSITGTSKYLSSGLPLEDAILKTEYKHGDMILNTKNIVNPSLLIEGEKLKNTLEKLSEKYRYVFIDSPPLDLVSDSEKIGSLCDGAIMVVRGGETSKKIIRNSIQQLERAGCPLLGIVLNRVEGKKGSYYKKRYGGKYGQYGEEYYKE